jgi:2,4-dienoyl-CoA reductase (NADPH2)
VTLGERSARLGGAGRAAAVFEPANRALIEYLVAEVARLPVDVRPGCEVTPALVGDLDPDVVVVAVGARPVQLNVPGGDREWVFDLDALWDGPQALRRCGTRIAIVGGDLIGVEVAECLSGQGCEVAIIDAAEKLATQMAPPRRWRALHLLKERGVRCLPAMRVAAITPGAVRCAAADGREVSVPADAVLTTAVGPELTLVEALHGSRARVEHAGDCGGQGLFEGAFLDAHRIARSVGGGGPSRSSWASRSA